MIDAALVFKLADSISVPLRALVILAGFVGLRTGELLGLRRCDVDLEDRRLTVLVQAQQVVGMGRIVTGPKSDAGQRTVSLPTVALDALERHLADYGQPDNDGVLFTGPRGEPITRPSSPGSGRPLGPRPERPPDFACTTFDTTRRPSQPGCPASRRRS